MEVSVAFVKESFVLCLKRVIAKARQKLEGSSLFKVQTKMLWCFPDIKLLFPEQRSHSSYSKEEQA